MLPAVTTLQALVLFSIQSLVFSNPLPSSGKHNSKYNKNLLDVDLSVGVSVLTGQPEYFKSGYSKRDVIEGEVIGEALLRRQSGDAAEALRLHNAKRASRQLPALTWDSSLASAAQTWANRLAQQNRMEHSPSNQRPGQGENLAYAW